jgi:hypothetical protein
MKPRISIAYKKLINNKHNFTGHYPQITFIPPSENPEENWDAGEIPWEIIINKNNSSIKKIFNKIILPNNAEIQMLVMLFI